MNLKRQLNEVKKTKTQNMKKNDQGGVYGLFRRFISPSIKAFGKLINLTDPSVRSMSQLFQFETQSMKYNRSLVGNRPVFRLW
jgi:hypothetical protein